MSRLKSSYDKINYSIRPAKNIERKMLCEAFNRLSAIESLEKYRYIGFGSPFYIDFSLFHRSLGILNNVSIEQDIWNPTRFEFNRPYKCIRLIMGKSNDILPELSWNERTIIWMDYDGKLGKDELRDIDFISSIASSGSILVFSVNARAPFQTKGRVRKLSKKVGANRLPAGISNYRLGDWGTATYTRMIIDNEIRSAITVRNGLLAEDTQLKYKQLFNFHYKDSVEMLTVGGIIYNENESDLVDKCKFETLAFIRPDKEPCTIEVPPLTLKEIRHMNEQLPCLHPICIEVSGLSLEFVRKYVEVYKYYPAFVDAEIG